MKYRIRSSQELYESYKTAREKYGNVIPKEIMLSFASADIKRNYKYIEKMCELYLQGVDSEEIIDIFDDWHARRHWIVRKDITKKTHQEILNDIDEADERKKTSKSQFIKLRKMSTLYNQSYSRAYYIDSFNDIEFYGKGTKWCIAYDKITYDAYAEENMIYVIKNTNLEHTNKDFLLAYLKNILTGTKLIVNAENENYEEGSYDYNRVITEVIDPIVSEGLDMRADK